MEGMKGMKGMKGMDVLMDALDAVDHQYCYDCFKQRCAWCHGKVISRAETDDSLRMALNFELPVTPKSQSSGLIPGAPIKITKYTHLADADLAFVPTPLPSPMQPPPPPPLEPDDDDAWSDLEILDIKQQPQGLNDYDERLETCERCGRQWDGYAQCPCPFEVCAECGMSFTPDGQCTNPNCCID